MNTVFSSGHVAIVDSFSIPDQFPETEKEDLTEYFAFARRSRDCYEMMHKNNHPLSTSSLTPRQSLLLQGVLENKPVQVERWLKSGVDPNFVTVDYSAQTPLLIAAKHGKDKKIIHLLLSHGANPSIPDRYGSSPNMYLS
jgi:ankyrin repeat protein